jgi:hypothetical protein
LFCLGLRDRVAFRTSDARGACKAVKIIKHQGSNSKTSCRATLSAAKRNINVKLPYFVGRAEVGRVIVSRLFLFVILFAATPAFAQNCFTVGRNINCDNGVVARRTGGLTVFSNGSSAYTNGNTTTYSNGVTAQRNGNTTTFNNGVTSYTNGNTTKYSNGLTCYHYGTSIRCQ